MTDLSQRIEEIEDAVAGEVCDEINKLRRMTLNSLGELSDVVEKLNTRFNNITKHTQILYGKLEEAKREINELKRKRDVSNDEEEEARGEKYVKMVIEVDGEETREAVNDILEKSGIDAEVVEISE